MPLKIEHTEVFGWEAAIRGMRNPKNSWAKSDSAFGTHLGMTPDSIQDFEYHIGENDRGLMKRLVQAGPEHAKFTRMIMVTCDIVAMQPWWSEFDTYKVGTVRDSCSKMHTIHVKAFKHADFTHQGITSVDYAEEAFNNLLPVLERLRQDFNRTADKKYWRALIELLPEGYNLRATVQMSYQNLKNMYQQRRGHKLVEWREFCNWIERLPYADLLITGEASK